MPLLITVPYKDKEIVKALGAKWMPEYKKWRVDRLADYPKFVRWILRNENYTSIICDYFYVAEATINCEHCGQPTKVIAFGIENFLEIKDFFETDDFPFEYNKGNIFFSSYMDPLPAWFKNYLRLKYNYYDECNGPFDCYGTNHCSHCGKIQGDPFFLLHIFERPACIRNQKLNLYKVELNYDLISDVDLFYIDDFENDNKDEKYNNFFDIGFKI